MLTWVEIHSQKIKHNLLALRRLVGPKVRLMPVVKSNAYGHGLVEVAKICEESKFVDVICVVNLDEAITLLKNKIRTPIFILSFYENDPKKLALAIQKKVIFTVYNQEQLAWLNAVGESVGKKVQIHLKIDTGTTRVGIFPNDINNFYHKIKKYSFLDLVGVYSHLASSEENKNRTLEQGRIFTETVQKLEELCGRPLIKHLASSSASILYPELRFNAVRTGLATYGLYPSEECRNHITLKPALAWHTRLIEVKQVAKGTKISYGGTFTAPYPMKIGVLPIGYNDGFDRGFSSNGEVTIKDQLCPVVGRICMNLTMVDLTKVKNPKIGDTVTLIGSKTKNSITAENLAKRLGTINYEVVDRINPTLPRIIV